MTTLSSEAAHEDTADTDVGVLALEEPALPLLA